METKLEIATKILAALISSTPVINGHGTSTKQGAEILCKIAISYANELFAQYYSQEKNR